VTLFPFLSFSFSFQKKKKIMKSHIPVSQSVPENAAGQTQVKFTVEPESEQVPPFWQGWEEQAVTTANDDFII